MKRFPFGAVAGLGHLAAWSRTPETAHRQSGGNSQANCQQATETTQPAANRSGECREDGSPGVTADNHHRGSNQCGQKTALKGIAPSSYPCTAAG